MSERMNILITTDSVSDIPEQMLYDLPIAVCPYYVKTPAGIFLDNVEISAGEIMDCMEKSEEVSSVAPDVSDYRAFFTEQKKRCSEILHISMGKRSSKGYENARAAAENVPGVRVLDSGQISSGLGLVVLYAARLAASGAGMEEMFRKVEKFSGNVSSSFIVGDMKFLNRSGRLSSRVRSICEKWNLHPLLTMKNSRISVGGVRFGKWEAVKNAYIRHELKDFEKINNEILFITHAGLKDDELEKIKEETKKYADFRDIRLVEASAAVSSNCGRGTFGLLFAREGQKKRKGSLTKKGLNQTMLAVFAVALVLVMGLNVRLFYSMMENQARALGRQQLTEVSGELAATLYEAEIMTQKMAMGVELLISGDMANNREKLDQYLNEQKKTYENEDCMNVYAAGHGWYSIPDFEEPEGFVVTERDWYLGARKKGVGNIYITAPYLDARTGDMCFTISELLSDGDTVVAEDFSLLSLQESVSDITIEGGDSLIVSESGQIVGYPDTALVGEMLADALPQYTSVFQRILSSGQDSMYFQTKISGGESMVFYHCTQNAWYLLSVVSEAELYRSNLSKLILYTVLNLCFVFGILLLYFIGRKYRKRAERRLFRTEQAISDIADEIKAPIEEVVKKSDYRMLLSSDDPDEYMGDMKKSSVKLKSILGRLNYLSEDAGSGQGRKRAEIRENKAGKGKETAVSGHTNRRASGGIIVLLAVTMVFCIAISTTVMKNWGNTKMEREVNSYAAELDSWIVEQRSVLDMFVSYISTNPEILDDYASCVEWLNDITVQYEDISVSYMTNPDAEHIVIMNNGWEPDADWNMEERSWYIGSMETEKEDGFFVTAPYLDSQLGAYCVTISKRVYDKEGNYLGIFGIDFFLDKLTKIFGSSYTDEGYAFLADSDGNIINHPNQAYQMTEESAVSLEQAGYLDALYTGDTVFMKDYDGQLKAAYATTDSVSGFSVFCVQDWNVIYGSLVAYDILFVVIFGIAIAIAAILLRMRDNWQKGVVSVLEESVDEAKRAGEAKSKFLAQMSHEIRTPINAVLGMNEMVLRESSDPDILEYSDNIQSAGKTLLTLINSILDFSKIEDGKMEIVPVQYDTASMINDLVHIIRERAEKKGLLLKLEIDPNLPTTLYGDDVRLRQVITNILTNAVKYTQEGSVTLRIRSAGRTQKDMILHVEVEDTGMGIRDEDREALFESFTRLDMEKNRTIEGAGLGISIVQKLLLMMGSSLQLDSVYGKGSNFYFDIRQEIVEDVPIGDYEKRLEASIRKSSDISFVYAPDAKVLVVDDNNMNLKVAKGLLKRSAMHVETAASGPEAIEKIAAADYDILFLDHMMPGMDGIETLHELHRRGLPGRDMPVIMMTANAIVGAREEYLKEGFDDYISKPIEVKAMEKILKEYLPKEKVTIKESAGKEQKDNGVGDEESKTGRRIDESVGLSYCMDDQDFYHEMLRTYVEEAVQKKSDLIKALETDDLKSYAITVHAVKSTSKTIGAAAFSGQAYILEMAAKEGKSDAVRVGHDALMKEYDAVLQEAQGLLG